MRHFDCVGFVNYCMWKLTGTPWQLESRPGSRRRIRPAAEDGTIYQAEETKAGVTARGKFKLDAPGSWTHLVRLPN